MNVFVREFYWLYRTDGKEGRYEHEDQSSPNDYVE